MRLDDFIEKNYVCGEVSTENVDFWEVYEGTRAISYAFRTGDKEYKVFAFLSLPKTKKPKGGYPVVVLMHGGNGAAYYEFTKKWADRGYIAIAPDLNAQTVENFGSRYVNNENGGPKGYGFSAVDTDLPWAFFSTLSAMKAIDVLLMQKNADKNNVFSVGLSWGGYLNFLLMSQDKRIKAGSVIYSSAYTFNGDFGKTIVDGMSEDVRKNYFANVEPTSYLEKITCPVLFTAGTQDRAFKMINRQKTADDILGKPYYAIRKEFYHGNFYGFEQNESLLFCDRIRKNERVPQPCVKRLKSGKIKIKAFCDDSKLRLHFTRDDLYKTQLQKWRSITVSDGDTVVLPEKITAAFVTEKLPDGSEWSSKMLKNE